MTKIRTKFMLHIFAIPICLFFLHVMYKVKVWGKKHVPAKGLNNKGIIIMANHLSHLDPFLGALAAFPRFYKPFFYPADAKLWKLSLFRPILHGMNCFPVFKGSKRIDIIKYHISVINNGGSVFYFPEGARSKDGKFQKGKVGAGWIAHSTRALVIPCAIKNTDIAMPVGKSFSFGGGPRRITLKVYFGSPIDLKRFYSMPSSKKTSQIISDYIMNEIAKLIEKM